MARRARTISRVWGGARQDNAARLTLTVFTLLAFTFQTLVTQTHIHFAPPVSIAAAMLALDKSAAQKPPPDRFPPGDDPANCPICQELLHAGPYVTPSAAALPVSTVATYIVEIVIDSVVIAHALSHGWKSRGPPLA